MSRQAEAGSSFEAFVTVLVVQDLCLVPDQIGGVFGGLGLAASTATDVPACQAACARLMAGRAGAASWAGGVRPAS